MTTRAWKTAPQIALRNCFKEEGGKDSMYVILVKGEYTLSDMYFLVESFCWSCEASVGHERQSPS